MPQHTLLFQFFEEELALFNIGIKVLKQKRENESIDELFSIAKIEVFVTLNL